MWSGPVLIKPVRFVWGTSVILALLSVYYAWPNTRPPIKPNPIPEPNNRTFRAARSILLSERMAVTTTYKLRLLSLWNEPNYTHACAVTAPYIGAYINYVLYSQNNTLYDIFNMRVLPNVNSSMLLVEEQSPLCNKSVTKERYSEVNVVYDTLTAEAWTSSLVDPIAAACMQHLADVLSGLWPC